MNETSSVYVSRRKRADSCSRTGFVRACRAAPPHQCDDDDEGRDGHGDVVARAHVEPAAVNRRDHTLHSRSTANAHAAAVNPVVSQACADFHVQAVFTTSAGHARTPLSVWITLTV
eukprot:6196296-Pleurochrysis_carterae.AAC.2